MIRFFRRFGFAVILALMFGQASAHEVRPSIATLTIAEDRSFKLSMETNVEALLAEIGSQHEDTDQAPGAALYNELRQMPPDQLAPKLKAFTPDWLKSFGLTFGDAAAVLTPTGMTIPEVGDTDLARDSFVDFAGSVPSGVEEFQWAYPERYGALVLRIDRPGQETEAQFIAAGGTSGPVKIGVAELKSWWQNAYTYAVVGFTHIIPKGLDHILFVLGLFLLSMHWKPLLWQVTAFTLAHSVTLGLGLYGVISIAPSIVEPLIALSIVYVAVENIFTRTLHVWRPVIVFLFGLLHGLGFAGILTEIGLPRADFVLGLVSFNVGVELGQLAVIALAFAAVGWMSGKPWYRQRVTIPASMAIAAMGAWWFVERTVL